MLNGSVQIERIDPLDLDLDTAESIAEVERAGLEAAGLLIPAPAGAAMLRSFQLGSDGRPAGGLWLARDDDTVVGYVVAWHPTPQNSDSARLRGMVLPTHRRQGIGRALAGEAVASARASGRHRVYAGSFRGTGGGPVLEALGFSRDGLGVNAIRRVDLHAAEPGRWDRLYDDATRAGSEYELVHLVGPTPVDLLDDLVILHAAINDAPPDDPDSDEDLWDSDRVTAYDDAMAGRRQTVYRVMARHRSTGEWAGLSMVCVDEFRPTIAFQEDTSVVRAHRGHRLGLLMKADMLRWLSRERAEIAATDTWNATTNHHMIAVNERLGATVIAHHETYRLREV